MSPKNTTAAPGVQAVTYPQRDTVLEARERKQRVYVWEGVVHSLLLILMNTTVLPGVRGET